jgi:anhydro-N-acetylmuramic acid kinase
MPPKSLDRNDFNDLFARVEALSDADAAATLVAISVACVAEGLRHCPEPPTRVLVCGGGRHNAAMMQGLADALSCPVHPVEEVGLNGDMLEAQAFAFLAVRVVRKMSTSGPMTTGVAAQVGGGRISRPRG